MASVTMPMAMPSTEMKVLQLVLREVAQGNFEMV